MSRSEFDSFRKDECLQWMEQLGEAQPPRGVLVVELKAMIKDLLFFSKENGQEQPLVDLAKMNKSQPADNARQLKIPKTESHARGHLIRLIGRNLMQQPTPEGSDFLGFGEHGANDVKRPSGGSRIPLGAPQDRFLAEDAECSPRAERGEQHDIGATDETHQTTRRREFFAEQQAAKELDKRRKTPEQKGSNSETALEEENLVLKEQVRELIEQVQLLMTTSKEREAASSAESFCGMEGQTRCVSRVLKR